MSSAGGAPSSTQSITSFSDLMAETSGRTRGRIRLDVACPRPEGCWVHQRPPRASHLLDLIALALDPYRGADFGGDALAIGRRTSPTSSIPGGQPAHFAGEGSLAAAEAGNRHAEMAVDVVLGFVWGALYVLERWGLLEGAGSRSRSRASVAVTAVTRRAGSVRAPETGNRNNEMDVDVVMAPPRRPTLRDR
ncbi:hypothetical protein ACHAXT_012262 [Thalassiosira profunda]